MIVFITINSGLVPLIEGLCAQIYYLRFEIIGGLRSHLLLFFSGRKKMLKEKSKISSRLLAYIYTCVLCTHIRLYVCRDLVHLDSSGPPGVSSRLLGSHTSTSSVMLLNFMGHMYVMYPWTTYMWSLCNIFMHPPPSITPFVALSADHSVV